MKWFKINFEENSDRAAAARWKSLGCVCVPAGISAPAASTEEAPRKLTGLWTGFKLTPGM